MTAAAEQVRADNDATARVLAKRREHLASLPPEEPRREAIRFLKRAGILNQRGNLARTYQP